MVENVAYNPGHYGLVEIGSVELSGGDWEFDELMVLHGEDGYYLATDSGCSCPMPFENYGGVEDLTGPLTAAQAREESEAHWNGYDREGFDALMAQIV